MGFGAALQGTESHDALVRIQDAEIRLLENIRRCVQLRIRSDQDYGHALQNVCHCAHKLENSEFDTPVFQAWNSIIKETESVAKVIKSQAEKLNNSTMKKLVSLIAEKKAAKIYYERERQVIDFEYAKLRETVNKNHTEYRKVMERTKSDKEKYVEQLQKGKTSSKCEETKARYLKGTMRLHKVHNDYVLSLLEFQTHQDGLRTTILPGFLDYQQEVSETLVKQSKNILLEYTKQTDLRNEELLQTRVDLEAQLQALSPGQEYNTFLEDHSSEPFENEDVTFDEGLLTDYDGRLQINQIELNDLTAENLNHSRTMFEERVGSCKQRIETKQQELNTKEDELAKLPAELDDTQQIEWLQKQRTALTLRRDIVELNKNLEKDQSYFDILDKLFLNSNEECLPRGLELDDQSSNAGGAGDADSQTDSPPNDKKHNSTSSPSNSAPNTPATPGGGTVRKRTTTKIRDFFRKTPSTARPSLPTREEVENQKRESFSYANGESSNDPAVATATDTTRISTGECAVSGSSTKDMADEEWYHGVLPREEVQRLLINDGDFLVRESKNRKTGEPQLVLSVMWNGHKHFIIQGKEGEWRFEGDSYPTIQLLIAHQLQSGAPVTNRSQAILKIPILRSEWQLKNDDITLDSKIGNGNFGEVYKGVYKGTEVAVKTCREMLDEEVRKKFLQEGKILQQYDHANIVKFIGIAAQKQPVMIVMEYVPGGSLLNFLKTKGRSQTPKKLVFICTNAAAGMEYLESRNCIHRDLAARNCLVGRDNVVKIADFGMSREEEIYIATEGMKQIPIKWTAPEALEYGKYTSKCDVWSFGILMWEVFSQGSTPYPGMNNHKAKTEVRRGYRMDAPSGTPPDVFKLMRQCWDMEPNERPHFETLHTELKAIHLRL
ncbi:tyrosine-protein kinase Fer-like [Tubulanus polymorphus]|uniref:tyrosine-protein kinase Fer-like n=1 Tax=Tubulanus polymorphus TaxID=672921 RepID=UPI003DA38EC1